MSPMFRVWLLTSLCLLTLSSFAQTSDYGFEHEYAVIVQDSDSSVLPKAWEGGMNACHFNQVDIDLDGNKDLVVFDKTGDKISCYRNSGLPGMNYTYMPEWEHLFPPASGWIQLRDFNCDGKEDFFAYAPAGIQVWKNVSDTLLKFQLMTMLLNSWQGSGFSNIGLTYVDYPAIEDIDGDGDLDILVFFGLGSYVQMHRNNSMELTGHCDSLIYQRAFNCWGDFAENASDNQITLNLDCPWKAWETDILNHQKDEAKHTGSTMLLLDINGDSVKDLVLGDVDYLNLILLHNSGTRDTAHMASTDTLFPSETRPVNIVSFPVASYLDLDNDSLKELLVAPFDPSPNLPQSHNNIWLYENTGTAQIPEFSFTSESFLQSEMIDVGTGAYPVLFDADADGLTDLMVADYGYLDSTYYEFGFLKAIFKSKLAWYKNTGSAALPQFKLMTRDYATLSQYGMQGLIPAFGDLDGDGDEDMVCGETTGKLLYFENTAGAGNPAFFAAPVLNWQGVDVGDNSAPSILDLDADGLLDLVIGKKNGMLSWYRNTGTVNDAVLTLADDSLGKVNVADYNYSYDGYSTPCFFRDSAGLLKLAVGSESGRIFYYKDIETNISGTFTSTDSVLVFKGYDGQVRAIDDGYRTALCIRDWDQDLKPDLITGNYRGGLCYYKGTAALPFNGTADQEKPAGPGLFVVYPNPCSDHLFVRSLAQDASQPAVFGLFDLQGRNLMERSLERDTRIDLTGLDPGIYLYRISGREVTQSGKIIIGLR